MMPRLLRVPQLWLLLAAVLTFAPWLLHPTQLPWSHSSDMLRHYLPFKDALHTLAQAKGGLPAWNPYLLGGQPLAADPGVGAFYPLALPFYFLPPERCFTLFFLAHIGLGAFFAYRFLRSLGLSAGAASFGTLTYGFNLKLLVTLYAGFATMVPAQAWLPGAFLALQRLRQASTPPEAPPQIRPSRWKAFVGLAACLSLQVLAGDTQLMLYTALILGGWILLVPVDATRRPTRRIVQLLTLGGAFALALLLAAPLLLPAGALTGVSTRAGGIPYAISTLMSLPPSHLPALFFPALGGSDADFTYRGPTGFWEVSFYPGILTWLLFFAVLFAGYRRDRRVIPLALVSYATLLLSFGRFSPAYPLLFFVLPGFNHFRGPGRFLPLLALSVSTLAAIALDQLEQRDGEALRRLLTRLTAATSLLCLGLLVFVMQQGESLMPVLQQNLRAAIKPENGGALSLQALTQGFLLAGALLAVLLWRLSRQTPVWRQASLLPWFLGLTALDLTVASRGLIDSRPADVVLPRHALAQALAEERGAQAPPPARILDLSGSIPDLVAVRYRLPLVNGMNPLVMRGPYLWHRHVQGDPPELPQDRSVYGLLFFEVRHPQLLDLMRVGEIITADARSIPGFERERFVGASPAQPVTVFQQFMGMVDYPELYRHRRLASLPAAWLVTAAALAPEENRALFTALETLDPFQGVLLDPPPSGAKIPDPLLKPLPQLDFSTWASRREVLPRNQAVEIKRWDADVLEVGVDVPGSGGVLVFSEVMAPCWKASEGETPLPLWTANGLLRALVLDGGTHRIRLECRVYP